MILGIVSASTRRPASARAAAIGVVWSSSSSRSIPILWSSNARSLRALVVLLVTKRRRWPASRNCATATDAPGTSSHETWSTPSTSSKMAAMDGESIRVTRSVTVPRSEIELRFSRSSGPGGQHAQKTESRVEAVFDVEASTALTERQKSRVVARAGPVVRAIAQDERSQWRNRELAVERLGEQLRAALRGERPRRPTKPTKASRERRLEQKRRRSEVKRLRKPL